MPHKKPIHDLVDFMCAGVSEKVLQQKATTRTMFAKMLYLTETEQMLQPNKTVSADIVRKVRPYCLYG